MEPQHKICIAAALLYYFLEKHEKALCGTTLNDKVQAELAYVLIKRMAEHITQSNTKYQIVPALIGYTISDSVSQIINCLILIN